MLSLPLWMTVGCWFPSFPIFELVITFAKQTSVFMVWKRYEFHFSTKKIIIIIECMAWQVDNEMEEKIRRGCQPYATKSCMKKLLI